MPDPVDPPQTFAEAEERFSRFLVENGYPPKIRWILRDHLALDTERNFLLRVTSENEGLTEAQRRYSSGLEGRLGIIMEAICATQDETIARIYIPTDTNDSQRHRVHHGLKLACPSERRVVLIREEAEWDRLGYDIGFYTKLMRESFEL
jgi:hypothetical protein